MPVKIKVGTWSQHTWKACFTFCCAINVIHVQEMTFNVNVSRSVQVQRLVSVHWTFSVVQLWKDGLFFQGLSQFKHPTQQLVSIFTCTSMENKPKIELQVRKVRTDRFYDSHESWSNVYYKFLQIYKVNGSMTKKSLHNKENEKSFKI